MEIYKYEKFHIIAFPIIYITSNISYVCFHGGAGGLR